MAGLVKAFGAALALCWSGDAVVARPDPARDAIPLLRHHALSACLAQAFPAMADEARAAESAYLEFGSHPAETYRAVQDMAQRWLKRSYPSIRDAKLDVMKCIDLSESAELGALARRTLPRSR